MFFLAQVSQYSIEGLPAPAVIWRMAAPSKHAVVTGLGVPVPLTLGFGTRAANRAMKSTGSNATWVVPCPKHSLRSWGKLSL